VRRVRPEVHRSGFLGGLNVARLPREEVERYGDPATLFFNVNSPEDLDKAEEMWRRQHD